MIARKDKAKMINTKGADNRVNGFLIELLTKSGKTLMYLTTLEINGFKGYHYHNVRTSNYTVVKGKISVTLYKGNLKETHFLNVGDKLRIPKQVATGLKNEGEEEAWLINYSSPPYDPDLVGEQIEFTAEEIERKWLEAFEEN